MCCSGNSEAIPEANGPTITSRYCTRTRLRRISSGTEKFEAAIANASQHPPAPGGAARGRGAICWPRAPCLISLAPVDRMEDRAVGTAMMLGLLGQPARVLAAGSQPGTIRKISMCTVRSPGGWPLHRLEGKTVLARQGGRMPSRCWQRLAGSWQRRRGAASQLRWRGAARRNRESHRAVGRWWESPPRVTGFAPIIFACYTWLTTMRVSATRRLCPTSNVC